VSGESYIEKYLRFTAQHEFPNIFATWCAIAGVGFAVGRSVWLNPGYGTLYPNHYIILVAGSGACRKGAAVGLGRKIIREAIGDREDRLLIPGKIYPEALIQELDERVIDPLTEPEKRLVYRPILIFSPELGSFMSKGMQSMGMPDLLTEIYDCPDEQVHLTKNSGKQYLKDVHVSVLGATTPKWMQDNMTPAIFGEGFIARTILVYASRPKRKQAFIDITEETTKLREELVAQLKDISLLRGEMEFTPDARATYMQWYEHDREEPNELEVESGFYEREHDHILKLAMIFSLSAGANMKIYPQHIIPAISMLKEIRSNMSLALDGAQADPSQRNTLRVLSTIKIHGKAGGITARDLARRLHPQYMDINAIHESLVILRSQGSIERQKRVTASGEVHLFYRVITYMGVGYDCF